MDELRKENRRLRRLLEKKPGDDDVA